MAPLLTRCPRWLIIAGLGLVAFVLLAFRFSPNWIAFSEGIRDAKRAGLTPAQNDAIDRAIFSAYSERGYHVLRQSVDLRYEIDDSNHKIVRWRLLFPALGHFLHLPGWATLGLAHLGCLALILALTAIGWNACPLGRVRPLEAFCLAIVAGATPPFFTSMGWLGYYDSWLALGLLAVAFSRSRTVVTLAALLTPWVDERFVVGLPLALLVRWNLAAPGAIGSVRRWLRDEAAIPVLASLVYAIIRLRLGGSGGSQTVGQYVEEFVFSARNSRSILMYVLGLWSGLCFGWPLVAVAIFGRQEDHAGGRRTRAVLLGAAVLAVAVVALATALDKSRSMVLLLPVVPLGWGAACRLKWWNQPYLPAILALGALIVPARQVIGRGVLPVDNSWSIPQALGAAQTNIGLRYATGNGVPQDAAEAVKWYRRAAERGYASAENNLGALYTHGVGVQKDPAAAATWYRKAAEHGLAIAQHNLAVAYEDGTGVSRDLVEAAKWYRAAAEQDWMPAQFSLGVMFASGQGVAKNEAEAVQWFRRAAELGSAEAQNNLALHYYQGSGVEVNLVEAFAWLAVAGKGGNADARRNLSIVGPQLTGEQRRQAVELAERRLAQISARRRGSP